MVKVPAIPSQPRRDYDEISPRLQCKHHRDYYVNLAEMTKTHHLGVLADEGSRGQPHARAHAPAAADGLNDLQWRPHATAHHAVRAVRAAPAIFRKAVLYIKEWCHDTAQPRFGQSGGPHEEEALHSNRWSRANNRQPELLYLAH